MKNVWVTIMEKKKDDPCFIYNEFEPSGSKNQGSVQMK